MLDFTCEYGDYRIDSDLNLYYKNIPHKLSNLSLSDKDAKRLAEALEKAGKKLDLSKLSFDERVKAITKIRKYRDLLVGIRTKNLDSYYVRRGKSLHETETNRLDAHVRTQYFNTDYDKGLSIPQVIVLDEVSDHNASFWYDVEEELAGKYLPISRSTAKMEEYYKELTSFPYEKYLSKEKAKEILNRLETKYNSVLKSIDSFITIADMAGNDLVNWSRVKITRRINDNKLHDSWHTRNFLDELDKSLRKKGVVETKKEKKKSRAERLEEKLLNEETLTQEELLTLFKQTDRVDSVLSLMEWETILEIMSSPLKVIATKLNGRNNWDRKGCKREVLKTACKIMPNSKKNFLLIKGFVERMELLLEWNFISKHLEYVSDSFLTYLTDKHSDMEFASKEVFERLLNEQPVTWILDTNKDLTKEYVSRLSIEDRISILPRLAGNFIKTKSNAASFILADNPWDTLESVRFNHSDFMELYKDVPWNEIRETVKEDRSLLKESLTLILENKDTELAKELLKQSPFGFDFNKEKAVELFNLMSEPERVDLIIQVKEESRASNSGYERMVGKILLKEESVISIFEKTLENYQSIFTKVVDLILKRKYDLSKFRKIILEAEHITTFTLNKSTLQLLTKECKLKLLKDHTNLVNESYSNFMGDFFKDLSKQEIVDSYGDAITRHPERLHLQHLMTEDEKILASKYDTKFFRTHVDKLPKSYLAKFHSKELFKQVVGDRRDPQNRNFGARLESLLEKIPKQQTI